MANGTSPAGTLPLSTFRLIFTDTRHKHGESRLVRADLPYRRNNTRRKRGKSRHKRADFRRLIAEHRPPSPRR